MLNNNELKYQKALEYEIFLKEEYGFSKEKIKEAKTIFDVWWHIGFFSEWCRKYNQNAKIYYFEPVKNLYNQANERLWNDDKIFLYNYWIANESKSWIILVNEEKSMQSSKYESFLNKKWLPESVEFITLSDAISKTCVDYIDVLKMDIEWMEFEVLNNLDSNIRNKIGCLVFEAHLLDEKLKKWWDILFNKLGNQFKETKIFPSGYNDKIFLVYAVK